MASHLLAHVVRRSTRSFRLRALYAYPLILLKFYQPIILPGLVGLWLVLRRPGRLRARGAVLAAWIILPRGALQPGVLPDAAVHLSDPAAARALRRPRPRPDRPARRRVSSRPSWSRPPRWSSPSSSGGPRRSSRGTRMPPSSGTRRRSRRWRPRASRCRTSGTTTGRRRTRSSTTAERLLAASSRSGAEAVEAARRHGGRLLLVTRRRLPELAAVERASRGRPGGARLGPAPLRRGGRRPRRLTAARPGAQGCSKQ